MLYFESLLRQMRTMRPPFVLLTDLNPFFLRDFIERVGGDTHTPRLPENLTIPVLLNPKDLENPSRCMNVTKSCEKEPIVYASCTLSGATQNRKGQCPDVSDAEKMAQLSHLLDQCQRTLKEFSKLPNGTMLHSTVANNNTLEYTSNVKVLSEQLLEKTQTKLESDLWLTALYVACFFTCRGGQAVHLGQCIVDENGRRIGELSDFATDCGQSRRGMANTTVLQQPLPEAAAKAAEEQAIAEAAAKVSATAAEERAAAEGAKARRIESDDDL